jgi:hypothetical protein
VAQVSASLTQGPEFKPQYHPKKRDRERFDMPPIPCLAVDYFGGNKMMKNTQSLTPCEITYIFY